MVNEIQPHPMEIDADDLSNYARSDPAIQTFFTRIRKVHKQCILEEIVHNSSRDDLECFENERIFRIFTSSVSRIRRTSNFPELIEAVYRGYIKTTQFFIQRYKERLNASTIDQAILTCTTYKRVECPKNKYRILKTLLSKKKQIENIATYPSGPLQEAVISGNTQCVRALLDFGYPIDNVDEKGSSALHYAILPKTKKKCEEIFDLLILRNCNPNIKNNKHHYPLTLAIAHNRLDHYKELLNARASEETVVQTLKTTPFHLAIQYKRPQFFYYFLQRKVNLEKNDYDKRTPLHILIQTSYYTRSIVKNLRFKKLIKMGADPRTINANGDNLIHTRLNKCDFYRSDPSDISVLDDLMFLVNQGVDPNKKNNQGVTPIFYAVGIANEPVIEYLLQQGCDPCARDFGGNTPLHYFVNSVLQERNTYAHARLNKYIETLKKYRFLSYLHTLNTYHQTPLMLLLEKGQIQLAETLLKHVHPEIEQYGMTVSQFAMSRHDNTLLYYFLDKEKNIQSLNGDTPLHTAARNTVFILEILKSQPNFEIKNNQGLTPLHEAVKSGNHLTLNYLIDAGANVNAETKKGQNALFILKENFSLVLDILLSKGITITKRDRYGLTCLHTMQKNRNTLFGFATQLSNRCVTSQAKKFLTSFIKHFVENNPIKQWTKETIDNLQNIDEMIDHSYDFEIFLLFSSHHPDVLRNYYLSSIKGSKVEEKFIKACSDHGFLDKLYKANPIHLKKVTKEFYLPEEEPDISLDILIPLYKRVSTLNNKLNHAELKDEVELKDSERIIEGLKTFIHKLRAAEAVIAAPKRSDKEKLDRFWKRSRTMVKSVIKAVQEETAQLENDTNVEVIRKVLNFFYVFSEAGHFCATRINEAANLQYQAFFSPEKGEINASSLELKTLDVLQKYRTHLIQMFSKDVHERNALFHLYRDKLSLTHMHTYEDPTLFSLQQSINELKSRFNNYFKKYYTLDMFIKIFAQNIKDEKFKWSELEPYLDRLDFQNKGKLIISNFDDFYMNGVKPTLTRYAILEILKQLDIVTNC